MKKDVYDLSKPQESIWLPEQYFKNTNINDISCYEDFSTKTDNVDFDKLKKAINNTIKNNDVFQTRLFLEDGNVKQYFCDFKEVDFPIYEISSLDELTKEEAKNNNDIKYIRVLGFSNAGRKYLSIVKKTSSIPIITNFYKDDMLLIEKRVTDVYSMITCDLKLSDQEYKNKPINK